MIVESNSRYRHVDDVPFQKTVSELGNVNIHMLSAGRSIPLVILTPTECCLRQMRVESPRGYSKGHLLERVLGVQGLRSEACNMECMCIADFIDEKSVVDASIGNIWDCPDDQKGEIDEAKSVFHYNTTVYFLLFPDHPFHPFRLLNPSATSYSAS